VDGKLGGLRNFGVFKGIIWVGLENYSGGWAQERKEKLNHLEEGLNYYFSSLLGEPGEPNRALIF